MRTYLVTGGAGFIGSNYIHYMFRKYGDEIRIINVDKLTYAGNLENLKDVEVEDLIKIAQTATEKILRVADLDKKEGNNLKQSLGHLIELFKRRTL